MMDFQKYQAYVAYTPATPHLDQPLLLYNHPHLYFQINTQVCCRDYHCVCLCMVLSFLDTVAQTTLSLLLKGKI